MPEVDPGRGGVGKWGNLNPTLNTLMLLYKKLDGPVVEVLLLPGAFMCCAQWFIHWKSYIVLFQA